MQRIASVGIYLKIEDNSECELLKKMAIDCCVTTGVINKKGIFSYILQ
mgnify:FL=1